MRQHLVEVHHVGVFVVHVEQIYLVRELAAIEAAFLDQYDMETAGIGVDHARAHTSRRAFATHDESLHAELSEMSKQRRAVERAGALLGDDDIARLRLELGPDVIVSRIENRSVALGG